MMWINWRIVFTGLFLILFTFTLVFAWDGSIEGSSPSFKPGDSRGYYVWRDTSGIHVWASSLSASRHFGGTITTAGRIQNVQYSTTTNETFYELSKNCQQLHFDFYAANTPEGFSFTVRNGSWITVDLFLDGKRIDLTDIHLGHHQRHPGSNSFRISL